jgi:RNA polymerase sigma-70 factor (ECF subfamily)
VNDRDDPNDFKRALQGDPKTIECLFRQYYNSLCNYCRGIVETGEAAEDIVQDVFVYLWDHRASIDMTNSVRAYLYTAVRNGALKYLRKQAMEQAHASQLTEFITYLQELESPEQEHLHIEKVKRALNELPDQCRAVFLMNCLEGKKYKEIAGELDISVNTVKTHLSRAYGILREKLGIKAALLLFLFTLQQVTRNKQAIPAS